MKNVIAAILSIVCTGLIAQNLPGRNVACLIEKYKQANIGSLKSYNAKIATKPDSAAHYYALRGAAYYHLGDIERGLKDCDSAIAIDPECFVAYHVKLNIYYTEKDVNAAKQVANAAIKKAR